MEEQTVKWTKIRIKTVTEAEDIIISELYDLGLEGAQIEDKIPLTEREKAQMFVDIPLDTGADDGVAYLSFYAEKESDEQTEKLIKDVESVLQEIRQWCEIGEGSIEIGETEDLDWVNNWKKYFHQFYVDDLLVIPSWEKVKPEDQDKMILHIDPGTVFGTGMHETTQLCIRQLKKYVTPTTKLLDVGTGSGILAILGIMFGAESAVGTDLDPLATDAVHENMETNHIPEDKISMMIGNIITEKEIQDQVGYQSYDIVVANILANVLVDLTPVIVNQLKDGGIYITSGIINEKEEQVREAVEKAGLTILEVTYQGEWVSVTARK